MEALETRVIPLFPLSTVLFPDGPLPLRVFEPRYLDMVSRCMKNESEFGVLLILSGSETGPETGAVRMASIGTTAGIQDWYQGSDGILGITAVGRRRFKTISVNQETDGLYMGEVDDLDPEPGQRLPNDYDQMASLLELVINDLGKLYENIETHYDDATWVGRRFAEILPISQAQKQRCLEMNDPLERLAFVRPLLRSIRQETWQ
jgi:Lon protease-like protein